MFDSSKVMFTSSEFLRKQLLKIGVPPNGIVFALFFRN
jgi:hypothetical protein